MQDVPHDPGVVGTAAPVGGLFDNRPHGSGTGDGVAVARFPEGDDLIEVNEDPVFQSLTTGVGVDEFGGGGLIF